MAKHYTAGLRFFSHLIIQTKPDHPAPSDAADHRENKSLKVYLHFSLPIQSILPMKQLGKLCVSF